MIEGEKEYACVGTKTDHDREPSLKLPLLGEMNSCNFHHFRLGVDLHPPGYRARSLAASMLHR